VSSEEIIMIADKAIRYSMIATVVAVAAVASWVSYTHALDVIRLAGETGAVAFAYPAFIDGVVYMSSMVLLNDARRQLRPHPLAYIALGAGVVLTLAANVYSMASHGLLGGIAGALPAVALVLSYELLMIVIRRSARTEPAAPEPEASLPLSSAPAPRAPAISNGHGAAQGGREAARLYAAELARGELPSVRAIARQMHVGAPRARELQSHLSTLART
jgi:Protein of unknown function (DUF2637)